MTDSAYRVPGELSPDPPKPRRTSWWAMKCREHLSAWERVLPSRREPPGQSANAGTRTSCTELLARVAGEIVVSA